jgi:hypothetical protein
MRTVESQCRDALAVLAAGGDPCDVGPRSDAGEAERADWRRICDVLREPLLAAAHAALASASAARHAGGEETAAAIGAAVAATQYQRGRQALLATGLSAPEPAPEDVQSWRVFFAEHGFD